MFKVRPTIILAVCLSTNVNATEAVNSEVQKISTIVARDSGYHALFLANSTPDLKCTLNDRVIILETDIGGKTLVSTALAAFTSNKNVEVRVSGCVPVVPSNPETTVPKVTKIKMLN